MFSKAAEKLFSNHQNSIIHWFLKNLSSLTIWCKKCATVNLAKGFKSKIGEKKVNSFPLNLNPKIVNGLTTA